MISVVIPTFFSEGQNPDMTYWKQWIQIIGKKNKKAQWIIAETRIPNRELHLLPWLKKILPKEVLLQEIITETPSRASSFNKAIESALGETIILLHEDCLPPLEFLSEIEHKISKDSWGGFFKKYDQDHILLTVSAYLQNRLRFSKTGNLLGTNGLVFPKSFWKQYPFKNEFLEDVIFSDLAKVVLGPPIIFPGKLLVSAKRYRKQGILKCLLLNSFIMFAFRVKLTPSLLSKLYPSVESLK